MLIIKLKKVQICVRKYLADLNFIVSYILHKNIKKQIHQRIIQIIFYQKK